MFFPSCRLYRICVFSLSRCHIFCNECFIHNQRGAGKKCASSGTVKKSGAENGINAAAKRGRQSKGLKTPGSLAGVPRPGLEVRQGQASWISNRKGSGPLITPDPPQVYIIHLLCKAFRPRPVYRPGQGQIRSDLSESKIAGAVTDGRSEEGPGWQGPCRAACPVPEGLDPEAGRNWPQPGGGSGLKKYPRKAEEW